MNSGSVSFERALERVAAGERLAVDEITALAAHADVLSLGMIADAVRRRLHEDHVTYVRVAPCPVEAPIDTVPHDAYEVRLSGTVPDRQTAVAVIQRAKAGAGSRVVSGLSWSDVVRIAAADGVTPVRMLTELRAAGLEALADVPLGALDDEAAAAAVAALLEAGLTQLRLTPGDGPADRLTVALRAGALQDRFGAIRALNPLAGTVRALSPSTGYDDVKAVALARIAAPNIMTVQVDWQRYGPKLAQVALTFGADDLDNVPATDETSHGHRRSLLAEVRRNIEAASFVPAERDGRFNRVE